MSTEKSLVMRLLSIVELVFLVSLAVSVALSVNYFVIKWYFEPVLMWSFVDTLLVACVLESIAFILIGIHLLQKRIEQSREGYILSAWPLSEPIIRHGPYRVVHAAKPKVGMTLIVAGAILFVIGMFIIPIYYKL